MHDRNADQGRYIETMPRTSDKCTSEKMDASRTAGQVRNGIDHIDGLDSLLQGRRLGLVTGPTGLDRHFRATIDILAERYDLRCLFSPEHGLYGEAQAGDEVASSVDRHSGLPVHSLYGKQKTLPPERLKDLDLLLFDMQDIGVRYYTFPYTLAYVMESCATAGIPLVVLDRVNPLGGETISGNLLDARFSSFVGKYPLPVRHGLTLGEFARWVNREQAIGCDLVVHPCTGWKRTMTFAETGLPWVMPSPNMPTPETLSAYVGTCLFEGTNLSEGRGTTKPFELIGAPFLDAWSLAETMNGLELPGVLFRPAFFRPTFSKHAGEMCEGVQLHQTDARIFDPFRTGLCLLDAILHATPAFCFLETMPGRFFIDLLAGTDALRQPDFSPEAFLAAGAEAVSGFRDARRDILLYE